MARKISRPIRDSVQAVEVEKERVLDYAALLSPEEIAAVKKKALLKVDARDKEEAMDRLLKEEMKRLDQANHPETFEQTVPYVPDLALFADAIRIDGKVYHHGHRYDVPEHQLPQLLDIEFQTKRHDREIHRGGAEESFYRRSRDVSVSMDTGQATAGGRPVRY